MSDSTPRGYSAVKRALEDRGYLRTPIDRLFLAGVFPRTGGVWARALRPAGLSGALAGPVLAVLLAAVLIRESRGLIPVWPDGILYAALFLPVMFVLVALAEILAALMIAIGARSRPELSPRRVAVLSGLSVAAVFACYLGVWWVRTAGEAGDGAPWPTLLLLSLGAGFVGRVISSAALATAVNATGRAPQWRRPRMALGTFVTAAGLLLLALLASWVLPQDASGASEQPVERAEGAPQRVVMIGWDGMSLDLLRGWSRRGRLPWASALLADGSLRALEPPRELDPIAYWVTLATGCPPSRHGVQGAGRRALAGASWPTPTGGLAAGPLEMLTRLLPGERRAVRSALRRLPSFWEITADAEKTAAINWWATWPASSPGRAGGYVVSDGALVAALEGKEYAEAVYPGAWGERRSPKWMKRAHARALAVWPEDAMAREALRTDLFAIHALEDAIRDPDVAVMTVYLPGLDILRERGRAQGRDLLERLESMGVHAAEVDAQLEAVFERLEGEAVTTLIGSPGRAAPGERGFALWPVRRDGSPAMKIPPPETSESIAPTWLALSGYTIDERICGAADADLLSRAGVDGNRAATRARPAIPPTTEAQLESEYLERLKSLGYID